MLWLVVLGGSVSADQALAAYILLVPAIGFAGASAAVALR